MNSLTKFLPAVLVFGLCAGRVLGNGFSLPDQDAFATARGEAFVATANNASAIYYNPAGITQVKGDSLRAGVYGIYLNPTYNPPAGAANSGSTYHSAYNLLAVPQLFYVHSLQKLPLSFGLGVYFPYGGSMGWPQATGFRAIGVSATLKYVTINPVVAWKVLPSLSIGAGAMANYVDMHTSQGFPVPASSPFINFFDFHGSGWSAGYNAGVLWQPMKQVSVGANFRSSAWVTLNGQTHYEDQPLIPNQSSSAAMSLKFPWTIVGGISYRPTPKWNLEFDANYTHWSSFSAFNLYQQSPPPPLNADNTLNFYWQSSWIYEWGVTRYLNKGWHISAGYVFNENSVPNSYYTPWAADMDRHFFSVGLGHQGKRFDFDITDQLGFGPPHDVGPGQPTLTVEGNISQTAAGKYTFFSDAVIVTAGIHF
jgi:long-chain fatty acid transport protein